MIYKFSDSWDIYKARVFNDPLFAKIPSTLQDFVTFIKKKNGPYITHAKWFHVKPTFNGIRDVRHQHELENLDKFLFSFTLFSCQSSLKFLQQLIHDSTNICLLWTRFDTRCLDTVLNKNRCVLCSLELAYSTILMGEMDITE